MPLFRYKALAADGRAQQGEMEAPSRTAAIARLQSTGHLPISAELIAADQNRWQRLLTRFQRANRISQQDIIVLTRELATLLQAGLPLDTALQTLGNISGTGPINDLIKSIQERVRGGTSLSGAMAEHGQTFSRLYLNMVRAGEAGGALEAVIDRVAGYLERSGELRSAVITALIYPAILVVIALISLFVLMTFVVPQFVPLFDDVGQALPLITQMVFGGAELLRGYWWVLLIIITLGTWYADRQLQQPAIRKRFGKRPASLLQ